MTLIEKQTRTQYKYWHDKVAAMLRAKSFNSEQMDRCIAKVKYYSNLLQQVPDEDS